ncbi:MAG: hypothetical protein OXC91_12205 [Rhodobacteraceae bacterium]|nr:hypothetical protein [Paracoccaceae bacterium]
MRPLHDHKTHPIPEPRTITVRDRRYQPSRAELEEEIDMPGMTEEELRNTFTRPFTVKTEK